MHDLNEFNLFPFGQFVGLTDLSGNKIFVGSIVKVSTHGYIPYSFIGEVVFYKCSFCVKYTSFLLSNKPVFAFHLLGKTEDVWSDMGASGTYTYTYEVIGNIHDNPELLQLNK